MCISCNQNYYPIFEFYNNYPYNIFYNCSKNPEGYYLDSKDSYYKKCYNTCKTCFNKGDDKNNNCLECKSFYSFKNDFVNDTNCYENCSDYYYYDNQGNYHCISNCSNEFNKLIEEKKRCIEDCSKDNIYKYEYRNKCYIKCPPKTKNNNYICEDFNCSFYYNYNQTDCINEIPEGYFLNDSYQKTIDKCHSNCRNCNGYSTINNNNCSSCFPNQYLNYGNCINNCPNGYYEDENDNSIKICKCTNSMCLLCPQENNNLCYSCNEPYYQIYNDSSNIFPYVNCYKNPEGYYLDLTNKIYKQCYLSCKTCSGFGDEKNNSCLECNQNFSKKDEFLNDTNCYKNCPFYYYFDNNKNYFCTNEPKCEGNYNKLIEAKNKCVDSCKKNDKYKYEFKKKCLEECPSNTKNNNFYCEIECPEEYPYEIRATQECVKNCSFDDITKQLCILNNKKSKQVNEQQNEIANNIQENLMNGGINASNINEGEDIVIKGKETSFTITTTENQKNNENKNTSTIDLGECETKLKNHYNISQNKSLFIFKVEVLKEGMKVPKIEYEVYYPLKGDNLEKLELTVCDDTKIELSIPVSIDEKDLEKHDASSSYYNDICYTSTSENGTDISLADRKNEFVNNNLTLCEEDCEFKGYDSNTKKASCSCEVKISLPLISEINIDKNKLYNSFSDIKNIANLDLMKCYDTLFSKKGLKKNYGFYILMVNILLFIICLIIFYAKEHKKFRKIIYRIIIYKKNIKEFKSILKKYSEFLKEERKIKILNKSENKNEIRDKTARIRKNKSSSRNLILNIREIKLNTTKSEKGQKMEKEHQKEENKTKKELKHKLLNLNNQVNDLENKIKKLKKNLSAKDGKESNPPNKKIKTKKSRLPKIIGKNLKTTQGNSNEIIENPDKNNNNNKLISKLIPKSLKKKLKKIRRYEEMMKLKDSEINNLEYKEALKLDQRTFCQYYFSLIKTKHLIAFTFFPIKDYNSRFIKISMFIFSFSIYFTVNALFFSDSTMHQIYEDSGDFNFIYQIPQILYSSLISGFLDAIIRALALMEKNVLIIKHEKNKNKLEGLAKIMLRNIFYKSIFFYLISFIILLICWYYLSCFCCIYKNTQLHLIKDTLISFSLSLIYPFGIYLIPGIFRLSSIKNKDRETMYKFSKFIQNI